MSRNNLIQFRKGTFAEFTGVNPVLASGEPGYAIDTKTLKIGDGTTAWNSLSSISGLGIDNIVEDLTPQLGGNLDVNSKNITGTANIAIIGNVDVTGNLDVDGTGTFTRIGIGTDNPTHGFQVEQNNITFNDGGGDFDFRVEGDSDQNLFFTDASRDGIGIGTNNPGGNKVRIHSSGTYNSENTSAIKIDDGTSVMGGLLGADPVANVFYVQSVDPGTSYGTKSLALNPNSSGMTNPGSVGIGTTNPTRNLTHCGTTALIASGSAYELDISASAATLGLNRLQLLGTETVFNQAGANYDFRVEGDTDQYLIFVDASTDRVGIGTNDPQTTLHVSGTASEGTILSQTSLDTSFAGLLVRNQDNTNVFSAQFCNSGVAQTGLRNTILIGSRQSGIPVKFYQGKETTNLIGAAGAFETNNERIIFDVDGNTTLTAASGKYVLVSGVNLGVGTTTPAYQLDVNGMGRFVHADGMCGIQVEDTGGSGIHIGDCAFSDGSTYAGMKHSHHSGGNDYMILSSGMETFISAVSGSHVRIRGGGNDTNAEIQIRSTTDGSDAFVINANSADRNTRIHGTGDAYAFFVDASTDRIGIGTSSPNSKLHVMDNSITGSIHDMIASGTMNSTTMQVYAENESDTNESPGGFSFSSTKSNGTTCGAALTASSPKDGYGWSPDIILSARSNIPYGGSTWAKRLVVTSRGRVSIPDARNGDGGDEDEYKFAVRDSASGVVSGLFAVKAGDDGFGTYITASGTGVVSLGLGTDSPSGLLHTKAADNASNIFIQEGSRASGSAQFLQKTHGYTSAGGLISYATGYTAGSLASVGAGGAALTNMGEFPLAIAPLYTTQPILFGAGNDEYMRSQNGNLMIGRQASHEFAGLNTLSIDGASGSFIDLYETGTARFRLQGDATYGALQTLTAIPIRFLTDQTERMRIDESGHIGIGATVPTNVVDVVATGVHEGITIRGTNAPGLTLHDNGGAGVSYSSGGSYIGEQASSLHTGVLILDADTNNVGKGSAILFKVDNTEHVRITEDGNVGIGTDSPSTKLEVANNGNTTIRANNTSNNIINILNADSTKGYIGTVTDHDLGIGTNSTTRIRISNSGNVGIGVDPDVFLSGMPSHHPSFVLGDGNNHTSQTIYSASTSAGVIYFADGVDETSRSRGYIGYYHNSGLDRMQFATSNIARMYIDSAGNVGVGTPSPAHQLHVTGDAQLNKIEIGSQAYSIGSAQGITHTGITSASGYMLISDGTHTFTSCGSGGLNYVRGPENNTTYQVVVGSQYMFIGTTTTERMTVGSTETVFNQDGLDLNFRVEASGSPNAIFVEGTNGNIGINRTSSSRKLTIAGTGTTDNSAAVLLQGTGVGTDTTDGFLLSQSNLGLGYLWNFENKATIFGTNDLERMRISESGNVGIGTATPAHKLDVSGMGRFVHADGACGLQVENSGGSGVHIGECVYVSGDNFAGMKHSSHIDYLAGGLREYMIISHGEHTLISAGSGSSAIIRGGNNNASSEVRVYDATNGTDGVVINEQGSDVDTRIEGTGDQNLFKVDASADSIGIGTNSPAYKLDVNGSGRFRCAPTGVGLSVVNANNSGLLFGEIAYQSYGGSYANELYNGMTHTALSGEQEYMILSRGDHTYISAKDGSASIIRGGNNNQTYQFTVSPSYLSVGQFAEKMKFDSSKVEFNASGQNLDFQVNGTSNNLFYVDASLDNVAIGRTPIANYKLSIDQNKNFSDLSASGAARGIDIDCDHVFDAVSRVNYSHGLEVNMAQSVNHGVTNSGYCMAVDANGLVNGSGTIAGVYGLRTYAGGHTTFEDSGVINESFGIRNRVLNLGSGKMTTAYGLYSEMSSGSGTYGGSIQNAYHIRLRPTSEIATSNKFGMYQEGTDDKNYFAGNVGLGTANPSHPLHVVGTGRINSLNVNGAYTFPTSDGTAGHSLVTDGAGNIVFSGVTGGTTNTAGTGLALDGTEFNVSGIDTSLLVGTITNAQLAGSIANAKLSNSAVTINAGTGLTNGGAVSLGGSVNVDIDETVLTTGTLNTKLQAGSGINLVYSTGDSTLTIHSTGTGGDGDITAVTAGTGLSGGGTTGAVTLNVVSATTSVTGIVKLTNTINGDQDKALTPKAVNDAGYLTAHPNITSVSSSDNSGRTYIQDILLDSNGHVTGIATAEETVTDTNTFTTGIVFNTGNKSLVLNRDGGSVTGTLTNVLVSGNNISLLNNDASYLTAHPNISAASSSDNSSSTFIQDILLDSNGHVTGLATATAGGGGTDTFTTGIVFNTGDKTLVLNRSGGSVTGTLTNILVSGQNVGLLNNDAGYLSNIVADTSPQLGDNLDLNDKNITGAGKININGTGTFTYFDGTCGLMVQDGGGSGIHIGDCALSGNAGYAGIKHSSMAGSNDYMIVSDGSDTYISAKDGESVFIRGGGNAAEAEIRIHDVGAGGVGIVFNEAGSDRDIRMEGASDANLFRLDASTDRIGIGTNAPATKLDVDGTITASGGEVLTTGTLNTKLQAASGINLTYNSSQSSLEIATSGQILANMSGAPANSTAAGSMGDLRFDSSYVYIAIGNNHWRRIAHSSF